MSGIFSPVRRTTEVASSKYNDLYLIHNDIRIESKDNRENKLDYKKAGVDISAGKKAVDRIKKAVESTYSKDVLSGLGKFGGFFNLDLSVWKKPVLISSTDGVGTKIIVAKMAEKYDTIGIDLVNHCVNDIFVHNAKPLFFLDYIGTGSIDPEKMAHIISGMVFACNKHKMALIGGEMAEMPDVYHSDIDIVGTIVGCTEKDSVINGETIAENDVVIGLPSTGLHTNGYTLARKILFDKLQHKVDDYLPFTNQTIAETLLAPHKSYYEPLYTIINEQKIAVHGMAHITGGGIEGNLSRIIPDGLCAEIDCQRWETPYLFSYMQEQGAVQIREMYSAFNMGIGFVIVVPEVSADKIIDQTKGIIIGRITRAENGKVKLENL